MPETDTPAPRNDLVEKIKGAAPLSADDLGGTAVEDAERHVREGAIDKRKALQDSIDRRLREQGLDERVRGQLSALRDRIKLEGVGEQAAAMGLGAGRATVETVMDAAKDVPNIANIARAAVDTSKPLEQEAAIKKLGVMAGVAAAGFAVISMFRKGIRSGWTWMLGALAATGIGGGKLWDMAKGMRGIAPPAPPAGPADKPAPAPGPRPAPVPAPTDKPGETPRNRLTIGGKQVEFTIAGGLKIKVGDKTYAAFDKDGPLNMITAIAPGPSGRLAVTMSVDGNAVPTTVGVADLEAILGGLRPSADTNANLTLTILKADTRKIPMAYDWIVRNKLKGFGALTEDANTWYCTPSLTLRPVSA